MKDKVSRREFLKLASAGAGGLFANAFGFKPEAFVDPRELAAPSAPECIFNNNFLNAQGSYRMSQSVGVTLEEWEPYINQRGRLHQFLNLEGVPEIEVALRENEVDLNAAIRNKGVYFYPQYQLVMDNPSDEAMLAKVYGSSYSAEKGVNIPFIVKYLRSLGVPYTQNFLFLANEDENSFCITVGNDRQVNIKKFEVQADILTDANVELITPSVISYRKKEPAKGLIYYELYSLGNPIKMIPGSRIEFHEENIELAAFDRGITQNNLNKGFFTLSDVFPIRGSGVVKIQDSQGEAVLSAWNTHQREFSVPVNTGVMSVPYYKYKPYFLFNNSIGVLGRPYEIRDSNFLISHSEEQTTAINFFNVRTGEPEGSFAVQSWLAENLADGNFPVFPYYCPDRYDKELAEAYGVTTAKINSRNTIFLVSDGRARRYGGGDNLAMILADEVISVTENPSLPSEDEIPKEELEEVIA